MRTSRRSGCRASGSPSTGASSTTATTSSATGPWPDSSELGIVSADTKLAPRPAALPAWEELSDTDKQVGARWMEVFCAAVEYTDHQIGRIVEAVEQTGELDNTLIVYIAGDNGPTPEGGLHGIMNKLSYWNGVPESLDDLASRIDDFGLPESHGCYPAAWAYATSTPFTYGKKVTSGGGCTNAAVVCWPARITDQGGLRRQFHHLIDVAPTILESAGVPEPERVNGIDQQPIDGVSMRYTFDDAAAHRPAHDAVLRAARQPGDLSRRLVGGHPPRRGRRDRRQGRRAVRPGHLGAVRHEVRFRPRQRPGGQPPGQAQGTAGTVRPRGPHAQRLSDDR